MSAIITVNNLAKKYRKKTALNGISLSVEEGELFALIGPDGAGKSSLLHIIAGIMKYNSGSVSVMQADLKKNPSKIRGSVGLMAQGLGHTLSPDLSIEENIDYFAAINAMKGEKSDSLKNRLLDITQLHPFRNRSVKNLSGGMKQKTALCCTLISSPKILLLDEPTTGVDPISRRDFYEILNTFISDEGVTVVVSTSYMDEAELANRAALMHEGNVIAGGTIRELKGAITAPVYELFTDSPNDLLLQLKQPGFAGLTVQRGNKLSFSVDSAGNEESMLGRLNKTGITFRHFRQRDPDMEFIFIHALKRLNKEVSELRPIGEILSGKGGMQIPESDKKPIIEIKDLSRSFGKFIAVDKANLQINRGEIFGFLGPNGAGKTTLIKMLCGLLKPTSGRGHILDTALGAERSAISQSIGYMSQKFSLYDDLKILENLKLFGGIYGLSNKKLGEKIYRSLELSGLEGQENEKTKSLPMGIKQRLALSCAILHDPPLLFLDEPTSGVDPAARDRFWRIIYQLSRRMGTTVIVTTHYMDEAERCDRLLLMNEGKIKAIGSPATLKQEFANKIGLPIYVCSEENHELFNMLKNRFSHVRLQGADVLVYSKDPTRDITEIRQIVADFPVSSIREGDIPFDQIFIHYVEESDVIVAA